MWSTSFDPGLRFVYKSENLFCFVARLAAFRPTDMQEVNWCCPVYIQWYKVGRVFRPKLRAISRRQIQPPSRNLLFNPCRNSAPHCTATLSIYRIPLHSYLAIENHKTDVHMHGYQIKSVIIRYISLNKWSYVRSCHAWRRIQNVQTRLINTPSTALGLKNLSLKRNDFFLRPT